MIITLLSWIIIIWMSCILGNTFIRIVMPETFRGTTKVDVYFVTGLMILNVYAQIYSIFAGVGRLAFSVALVVVILLSVRYLIKGIRAGEPCRRFINVKPVIWKICISIILAGIILILTMKAPEFVDTYLYHVQAIRWIEAVIYTIYFSESKNIVIAGDRYACYAIGNLYCFKME